MGECIQKSEQLREKERIMRSSQYMHSGKASRLFGSGTDDSTFETTGESSETSMGRAHDDFTDEAGVGTSIPG